jgi:hypothetical protein
MKQKRDVDGLADLRPNSGMNPTYHAYFEALRGRERRRRAEENRKNNQLSEDVLEKVFHMINKNQSNCPSFHFSKQPN